MKKGRRPRRRPRLKLSDKAGPDQCPVPGENALFPAQIAGFLAVSRAVPVYPVFLNYVVPVHWGSEQYFSPFPVLSLEAAEYLAAFPLKGVGTDAISIDPMDTVDYPVHKILLGAGFVNTENLCNLASIVGKTFPYATLPLRFKNADGSPVRAVAMPED